ncbi:hypothetical protein O181_026509 [Austropuccinia psidii MF-1]|uniref:Uncharacterized protein n=1 Tax=Austropuccinia psidii MF-1 TaxID=1389203 RepID=A0A9Q3CK38_9BASI|nr:hypothetical protein [Austropuccinia psidii MF-1]
MPTIAFLINTSESGQEKITVFYRGLCYTINCIPNDEQQLTPTNIPPFSFVPVTSLPKSNLFQMALLSFSHNDPTPPPIHINGFSGPTSSEIASIFCDSVPPAIITPNISPPIHNPLPPYKPHPVPASPPALRFRRAEHFNQIYSSFNRLFWRFVGNFYENYCKTAAGSSNPTELCCLRSFLVIIMELYNQMSH